MTNTTNETRICIGGVLHTYVLPNGGGGAMASYNKTGDARDPLAVEIYRSVSLIRTTPDGTQKRDFFVLDTQRNEAGMVLVEGLSDEAALTLTLADPDRFWK